MGYPLMVSSTGLAATHGVPTGGRVAGSVSCVESTTLALSRNVTGLYPRSLGTRPSPSAQLRTTAHSP